MAKEDFMFSLRPALPLALLLITGTAFAVPAAQADRPVGGDRVGAHAPYAIARREVAIAVADPDLQGQPVVLDASLLIPRGAGPFAALVINHGYLGSKDDDDELATAQARAGYLVLRYSSRGFGATKGQVDLVGPKEQRDLQTAVAWLNDPRHAPVWVNHIGQYGGSYGGAHALALAR